MGLLEDYETETAVDENGTETECPTCHRPYNESGHEHSFEHSGGTDKEKVYDVSGLFPDSDPKKAKRREYSKNRRKKLKESGGESLYVSLDPETSDKLSSLCTPNKTKTDVVKHAIELLYENEGGE